MRFDDGSELIWRGDPTDGRRRLPQWSRMQLLDLLDRADGAARCRAFLARHDTGSALRERSPQELADRLLGLLTDERIWWLVPLREPPRHTASAAPALPPPPPVAPPSREPPPRTAPPRDTPAPAPGTFPDDVDQDCLAKTIAAAAANGVPLCEECIKKANA